MAVASTAPIQIGRNRSPSRSRRRTMGWFVGSSTRTPTSCSSMNPFPSMRSLDYVSDPACAQHGVEKALHIRRDDLLGVLGERLEVSDPDDPAEVAVPALIV